MSEQIVKFNANQLQYIIQFFVNENMQEPIYVQNYPDENTRRQILEQGFVDTISECVNSGNSYGYIVDDNLSCMLLALNFANTMRDNKKVYNRLFASGVDEDMIKTPNAVYLVSTIGKDFTQRQKLIQHLVQKAQAPVFTCLYDTAMVQMYQSMGFATAQKQNYILCRSNPNNQNNQNNANQSNNVNNNNSKGGAKKFIPVLLILVIVIGAVFGIRTYNLNKKSAETEEETGTTSPSVITSITNPNLTDAQSLQTVINSVDPQAIDEAIGVETGDSYLAQEWAFVNKVSLREEYITKLYKNLTFESGENGSLLVKVPDYETILNYMDTDEEYIKKLFASSGYKPTDYTWHDEMANLMYQYLVDMETAVGKEFPYKQVEVELMFENGVLLDDSALDDLLFGNISFRNVCDKFSQKCVGWTGQKEEKYKTIETKENPEYKEWKKLFDKYYNEDEGHFDKHKSKWEPWYEYDENNKVVRDENGDKVVKYYSVKDANGNDWIEPSETIDVKVDAVRMVDDPWDAESVIYYNTLGCHYIQTEYDGNGSKATRVGDGTIDDPAGVGTSIITKALGTDNIYHDVRVTLVGYWVGQDAIDYAEKFDTRNRGFTTESVITLITYEIEVENLEDKEIIIYPEMCLSDKNSNISSKSGTLYSFTETQRIDPHTSVVINDWASSTEIEQKYVTWGKSFGREYPMVYFNILAGSGVIPPYSSYKQFTGESSIDENTVVDNSVQTTEPTQETTVHTEPITDTQTQTTQDTTQDMTTQTQPDTETQTDQTTDFSQQPNETTEMTDPTTNTETLE